MPILKRVLAACAMLLACCLPMSVFAFDETLTFRLNAQGEVEAVVRGHSRLWCDEKSRFIPPTDIAIDGNVVLIQSPALDPCSVPSLPVVAYEVAANLGHLTGERYQVTWNVVGSIASAPPVRSLSATLNVSDLSSVAAPALSPWALCLLLLSMAGVAFATRRGRGLHSSQ